MTQEELNVWEGIGEVTFDPELRHGKSGIAYISIPISCQKTFKRRDGVQGASSVWIDLKAFGKQAEELKKRVRLGTICRVKGALSVNSWEDKDGKKIHRHQIMIENLEVLGQAEEEAAPAEKAPPQAASARPSQSPFGGNVATEDDDLPF